MATMYVFVELNAEGRYTATLLGWPEMQAQGATEGEAHANLRQAVIVRLAKGRVMPLDIEIDPTYHPWLALAGRFKDDPFFDEVQSAIADYRRELDEQEVARDQHAEIRDVAA